MSWVYIKQGDGRKYLINMDNVDFINSYENVDGEKVTSIHSYSGLFNLKSDITSELKKTISNIYNINVQE